jgi:hypothetical protein
MYNGVEWEAGRIYIFFGSDEPDTVPDLIIEDDRYMDHLGHLIASGDFNGDHYADIIALASNGSLGSRLYVYLGSTEPDSICDKMYDYQYTQYEIFDLQGGSDFNNDGYDEYGWHHLNETDNESLLFLGDEQLHTSPDFVVDALIFLRDDISGDLIDDFVILTTEGPYLCLGGEELDIEPDYFMWHRGHGDDYFIYNVSGIGKMLLRHNWYNNYFALYNSGVPFDTIPKAMFEYDIGHFSGNIFLGDINADGNEDIITACYTDNQPNYQPMYFNVYSIIATSIKETHNNNLPKDIKTISCHPNPFNSSTIINYSGLEGGELYIYDISGRLVKTFDCGGTKEGNVIWDATGIGGKTVSSGIYFITTNTDKTTAKFKLVFLK